MDDLNKSESGSPMFIIGIWTVHGRHNNDNKLLGYGNVALQPTVDHQLISFITFLYRNWRHEPNDYAYNEDCGQMYSDGVLNDMTCQAHLGYICEYPKQGS